MKKIALLAAAATAMFSTPALAGGGYVGLAYSDADLGSPANIETWQAQGAYGVSNGALGFQFDGAFGEAEFGPQGIDHWRAAGHVFWDGGAWRLGGVYGVTSVEIDFFLATLELEESIWGLEGTYDIGERAVLGASYTFGQADYLGSGLEQPDTTNFDASLTYYFSDNLGVRGSFGVGDIDLGGDEDTDTTSYGLAAEWQPFSAPISFLAGWSSFESAADDAEVDTLSFAVRWNFGGSLRERDNATPFQTRTPLYQRAYGIP